ncbi:hypothetical protein PAECIP111893_00725 [Paenibacillus plantiphilus]|uniref:Oxygen sensor histidine kinase NreB n=1 Tax=Paenibacillus plantiphilus TaxID=2905650 RepID=A0ABM9BVP1_9BACL|nr:histidine kinase [Paenibacillus plantiphilus]CAH1195596.1 hypothetical protein PAECIP111893_00725 [Paenibacillus plantiphilus]
MGSHHIQFRDSLLRTGMHVLWWALAISSAFVSLFSHGLGFNIYHLSCGSDPCSSFLQMNTAQLEQLAAVGISPDLYGSLTVVLLALQNLSSWVVGILLYRYGWKDHYCITASMLLIATGTIFSTDEVLFGELPLLNTLFQLLNILGGTYVSFLMLFPNGHFKPRWTSIPALLWIVHIAGVSLLSFIPQFQSYWPPQAIVYFFVASMHILAIVMLAYRYTQETSPGIRRQMLWLIVGISGYAGAGIIGNLFSDHAVMIMLVQVTLYSSLLFIPFPIGVIVLESRARHMSNTFNRTMVYIVLSVLGVLAYALLVGVFGFLIHGKANAIVSLLATGLLAILFQPLRERVQKAVNRLVYGKWEDPNRVLSRLTKQLEESLTHTGLLTSIVEKVATALQIPYAAIEVYVSNGMEQLAVYGDPVDEVRYIELEVQGLPVGRLILGDHRHQQSMPPGMHNMVEDLARQVSIAVQSYSLADDLHHSRERLINAREEERRRLRRDLHDGLGSSLASMTLRLDEALQHHGIDPDRSRQALETVRHQMRESIADIRRLVYSLRPPALDEFGLAFALQELSLQYETPSLQVVMEGAERGLDLSAAAEVAVYRIVQEALTNVVRHANASICRIGLRMDENVLHIRIKDNGIGMSASITPGVGVRSIKERAEELGGAFALASEPGNGTDIQVSLPIMKGSADHARNRKGKIANTAGG